MYRQALRLVKGCGNRRGPRLILFMWLLMCLSMGGYASGAVCVKGVADLRKEGLGSAGALRLDGEWEFHWQRLLAVGEPMGGDTFTRVPGMWLQSGLPGQGYASYRLRVLLPVASGSLCLKVPEFSTAYELWGNGVLLAQDGKVSTEPGLGMAGYSTHLVLLEDGLDTLDLLLHVSNYHFYTGGVPQSILIGSNDVLSGVRESQMIYGAVLLGILLIIGLFFLGIYFFRPKEKYNLYYSLYCLLLAVNTLFVTERWLFGVCGPDWWPLLYRLFIAMLYLVLLVLILFYSAFFENVIPRWLRVALAVVFSVQALLVLVLPTSIGSWFEPLAAINLLVAGIIAIFIFAKAVWRRKEGAIVVALCNLVFLVSFVLDGMLTTNQITGIHISHYVTVLYVVAISLVLARRIAHAFNSVEALSVGLQTANTELSSLNKNLEAEVKERTRQVLQQEKMAALGQLTANIAHEINTPMGAIKASIETLSGAYGRSLGIMPGVMDTLTPEEQGVLVGLLLQVFSQPGNSSSREERQRRKELSQAMEAAEVPDAQLLASRLSHAGIYELDAERIALLKKPGIGVTLDFLFEHFEQIISAQNIRTALDRMSKIMFAIKLYARGGASNAKMAVNLEQEIHATVTLYNSWFKKGIRLETDYGQMPPLLCLADEMQQVWTNLILNAVQAMGNAGTLGIVTRQVGKNAVVTISDTGPGIPPEIIGNIFDPFFTTKASGEGSGLGLDIVRTIVNRHNGTITVESKPGHTAFTVTIPYATE